MQEHINRELWLTAAVSLIKPLFSKKGYTVPPCLVSCGFIQVQEVKTVTLVNVGPAKALSLEPHLIDLEDEAKELYRWDDPRLTDDEVEYALTAAGFDKRDIFEDDDLKQSVIDFLGSEDKDFEGIKVRLKPFLTYKS